ncbi:VWA domain-containing protein [Gracilibacillus sp. HCP3S3_G5_1]|uniref:VWA domain-containing protein n=1 Tax=unclassified Gracilibacillus TaxID=2625209 RepID=UPI003F8A6524
MKKLLILILFFSFSVIAACSSKKQMDPVDTSELETDTSETEVEEDTSFEPSKFEYYDIGETARSLSELEQELLRKPGPYSGDNYDEQAVQTAIDKLPGDLTADEYVHELIYLLAEDYHQEIETFANFNSDVSVDIERPDEDVEQPALKFPHFAILIDASGSMHAEVQGISKWEAAKQAVVNFAEEIPSEATISLRVYGHEGSSNSADKELSCTSTESIYNGNYNGTDFEESLNKIDPSGWTPIALALESSIEDIPVNVGETVVYVVSDGIETCDGDPVQAANNLIKNDIETVVNIIGFDVDNEGQQLLKEVATAGNGEFVYVNSETQLKDYMREQYEEIKSAWYEWKEQGKEQAFTLKEEKKQLATETKESVKEKAELEKERLKKAQEYLQSLYDDYDHATRQTFSPIIDYANQIWNYGVDEGNRLWSKSVDSGNESWSEFVDEGNDKISETIKKKNEQ